MKESEALARAARIKVLEMVHKAGTSHIGSNLSVIDILAVLYTHAALKDWDNRDRIILSKGWAAASLYFFLSKRGLIPAADLDTYCIGDSKYIGLAEPTVNGVEAAGGAMGHGLPMAVGMALALKRSGRPGRVFCIMSDGEMDCGTTWESALLAAHHKLDNLTVIVDCNGWQAMGRTTDVLNLGNLRAKWRAFGWLARKGSGHDHTFLQRALFWKHTRPTVVLAQTIKGKGVKFMEDKLEWHYKNIDAPTYQKALAQLV